MGRLGVVGGHSILGSGYGEGGEGERRDVVVDGVPVVLFDAGTHLVLQRHGVDTYTLSQPLEHRRHTAAEEQERHPQKSRAHPKGIARLASGRRRAELDASIRVDHPEGAVFVAEIDVVVPQERTPP
jgi:hypothetical protein